MSEQLELFKCKTDVNNLQKDEVFLGNTSGVKIPERYKSLSTIRVGNQAYDIKGEKLDTKDYRPLIIKKSEQYLYEKIYMKRIEDINRKYF